MTDTAAPPDRADPVPVIDISRLREGADTSDTIDAILRACRDIGFLSVTGTGVDPALVAGMRDTVRAVFAVTDREKWDQAITRENYRGYVPMGFFSPNDGSGPPDRYEAYKLHAETAPDDPIIAECPLYGPNRWPDGVPGARKTVLAYWGAMDGLAHDLLGALALGLGLAPAALHAPFVKPLTNMTLLHYPAQPPEQPRVGVLVRMDADALTIIAPDPVGGLEVRMRDGSWTEVTCPPGGFIVNIGDMLELWSGGRLVSTPHRVINRSGRARYSFPYFAVPRHDVTVRPLLDPLPGFDRPAVPCGHWSAEIWRTNWPDEAATAATPELGTLHDPSAAPR